MASASPPRPSPVLAAERAYTHLKEEILTGRLPGGHLFAEGDVAAPLGISRTPVREALLRLAGDGLVVLIPKRGAVVTATSRAEVRDVRDLRLAVELAAARRITDDALPTETLSDELTAGIAEQERLHAAGDLPGLLLADAEFHHAVVRASGNSLADAMYTTLADRQRRITLMWLNPIGAQVQAVLTDHRHLARLIGRRDFDGYERVLRTHLDRSLTALGPSAAT